MRAFEFITEYRDRLLQYVKSLLPTWPDYVLKDWLVPNKGDFSNLPTDALKNAVMEKVQGAGLTPNSKWQLVPNMKFTMDMFDPMTKQRLVGRAGGTSDLGMGIPKDKERHATQAALAQQQGGVRKEPVLLIKTAKGYELLEGWHRTIQHFAKYPQGYTGPAYVAVSQGQSVAESSLGTMLKWPEVVNKVNSAMKAMGWKGQRKDDGSFMFSTRGQLPEESDEWYIVIIDNRGNNMFTYALGTVEEGDPYIGEQETLPNTEASVSELMNAIREGFGLNESYDVSESTVNEVSKNYGERYRALAGAKNFEEPQ
jgi:hypothetical protein